MEKTIYEQMTDKIFLSGSKLIPQLFEMIASLDEADLLMKMPGAPAEVVRLILRRGIRKGWELGPPLMPHRPGQ